MSKLVDKLISKVDAIRQRVNVDKVGVRRYRLYKVIRTWSNGEVGDGVPGFDITEITPAPMITLALGKDVMIGRGRVRVGTMVASQVSLAYTESFFSPTLTAGQELYYKLVEMNAQGANTTYWTLQTKPEADRCENTDGNLQWILTFTQAVIQE